MRFSTFIVLSGLLATRTLATPVANQKRTLTQQSYADFQISDGTAGNARAEVLARFPIDMTDPANVSADDQKIISEARRVAESAETEGFNPAIEATTGDAAAALTNGKIKNKVLKLQLEVMDLMISQARGGDRADKIAEEQKKLDTNVATDKKNAGQPSRGVTATFTG